MFYKPKKNFTQNRYRQAVRKDAASAQVVDSVEQAYNAMIRLLTRREYSIYEIRQKLKDKYSKDSIETALNKCIEQGYQSEDRFAQMLVRHIEFAAFGPLKLRVDSQRKGADKDLIEHYASELEWEKIALNALKQKYSLENELIVKDYKEKNKALAFLARRGFYPATCHKALELFAQEREEIYG